MTIATIALEKRAFREEDQACAVVIAVVAAGHRKQRFLALSTNLVYVIPIRNAYRVLSIASVVSEI